MTRDYNNFPEPRNRQETAACYCDPFTDACMCKGDCLCNEGREIQYPVSNCCLSDFSPPDVNGAVNAICDSCGNDCTVMEAPEADDPL